MQLTSGDEEDAASAATFIANKVGKLDVVYANAGESYSFSAPHAFKLTSRYRQIQLRCVQKTPVADFVDHFRTNVFGPLVLFQATAELLRKAASPGKFIVITSSGGSTAELIHGIPAGAYGTSKAAINHLVRRIQDENKDLIVSSIW